MAIIFPGEAQAPPRNQTINKDLITNGPNMQMGMLSVVLDVNGQKRILINDGTHDRVLIGVF